MPERGRVIAGTARGVHLEGPRSTATRPLTDRVKESLFATLEANGALAGAFLDLFAGSGAGGIEALSRGAPRATFVERDVRAADVIGANLRRANMRTAATEGGQIVRAAVATYLHGPRPAGGPFSAVLLDPPYDEPLVEPTLEILGALGIEWLAPDAIVVAKHFWRDDPSELIGKLRRDRQKRFGETVLSFYTRAEERIAGEEEK